MILAIFGGTPSADALLGLCTTVAFKRNRPNFDTELPVIDDS